jgi:hypothetical protein
VTYVDITIIQFVVTLGGTLALTRDEIIKSSKGVIASDRKRSGTVIAKRG